MNDIRLVIFDLSGTTVEDDNAVAKCLHQAAIEHGLVIDLKLFQQSIGTNKIKLYQFMLAMTQGRDINIAHLEKYDFPELKEEALQLFERYAVIMLAYYRQHVRAMPGAEDVFRWCHEHGIKVVTDTGFHNDVNRAIIDGLEWEKKGLVDLALDVECTGGIGRPAPYMIFHAMKQLGIQSVHEVVKIGDTPADLLSGYHAGCAFNIGVLSGANDADTLGRYPHTHLIGSVVDLPDLLLNK